MNEFRLIDAWARGFRFVTARPLENALVLIGLALLLPFALQFIMIDGTREPGGPATAIVLAANYVLQSCALFTVLRLGLDARETLGRALGYGIVASLVTSGTVAVLVAIALMIASLASGPSQGLPFLIFAVLVPIVVAVAAYSTVIAAAVGTGLTLILVTMMVLGATTGNVGFAATWAGGGSGLMVVLLLLLSAAMVWAAARLSCAAAYMSDHRSLNVIAAVRASWELTWEEQGRITLYLALVGFGFVLLLAGALVAAGGSMAALENVVTPDQVGIGARILGFLVGIPLAYLTVLVPAGIYLQRAGEQAPVEVFA
jgi:hypothetical protein